MTRPSLHCISHANHPEEFPARCRVPVLVSLENMLVYHKSTSGPFLRGRPCVIAGLGYIHFGASAIDGRSSSGCLFLAGAVGAVDGVAAVGAVGAVDAVGAADAVDAVVTDCDGSRPLGGSVTGSSLLLTLSNPCALAFF